jgi:hypothetical protein
MYGDKQMSILDMNKEESLSTFNRHIPSGHIDKLKAESDRKSNTSDLTQSNSGLSSSHGEARQKREAIADKLEIKALETQTEKDYFYSLLEEF